MHMMFTGESDVRIIREPNVRAVIRRRINAVEMSMPLRRLDCDPSLLRQIWETESP